MSSAKAAVDVAASTGKPKKKSSKKKGKPVHAVLSIGANLGDREATLQRAVDDLNGLPKLAVTKVSPVFETEPVGGPEQPAYLNAVLICETSLSAKNLLAAIHTIEASHGRVRIERWGPRTLDIDIIDFGGRLHADSTLTLPHPRASERAFVLEPWRRIEPDAVLPGSGQVARLAEEAAETGTVYLRADIELGIS
ncbi:2-amino-4-hydroxy-6-hydroxymethyldihydropteridine diphosphokinase [Saxibacter everestensis]|uniref:2-amino-4-hydroxy-6-hydroxymethyldihydropteridine diphosphokinase n=1 Tax=Saxibacter everestensis TaxID=2909229 RepID=A0ABY8QPU8_9MICO|nr:2-amino-4-hydroxy-6-hydroxymethyldihydropteridine diphosphokinase [Brevibacteriaceae bacterium ZFBP1038]